MRILNNKNKMADKCENGEKVRDISEVLEKFGRYQLMQYVLACLPSMFVTMININYVFVAGDINYRCRIPECENTELSMQPSWWPNATIDRCSRPLLEDDFQPGSNLCTNDSFSGVIGECAEWIYESNSTIVATLDLACQPWKRNLVGTVHNVGTLFSMLFAGWIADRFGRKPALIIYGIGSCLGHIKTFATSYYMYVAVEFAESFMSGGVYLASTVMMIEIVGKRHRILAGIVFSYSVYVGELMFACLAMLVPYWKTLVRIINTPSILFISYIFLARESYRWQILTGKTDQAKDTIEFAAKMNKININKDDLRQLTDDELKLKFEIEKYDGNDGFKEIFTSREILKRLLVASVCRFTAGFVYYGLMINSVLLPGNKYTNFLLSTVMSFPGEMIALYFMDRVGRRLPLIVGYIFCGITCVASSYVPTTWAKTTFFLLGKMVISACYTGIITYNMELFPTSTRGSLLALGALMSRLGALLAPMTPMLISISPALPTIFFGGSGLLSGFLLTLTPETKDLPLMDTVAQVNASAAKTKLERETSASRDTALTDI